AALTFLEPPLSAEEGQPPPPRPGRRAGAAAARRGDLPRAAGARRRRMVDIFIVNDATVSTVRNVDTNLLVYSSLAAYGSRRGGRLPGSWFVAALGPLGHGAAAVRQSLFRMERDGELRTERRGRHKLCRLSPFGQASVDAGSEKLLGRAPGRWDGRWTVCVAAFGDRHRAVRDRLRDLLEVEGFAPLARGVMVHVRDKSARVRRALAATRPRPAVTL